MAFALAAIKINLAMTTASFDGRCFNILISQFQSPQAGLDKFSWYNTEPQIDTGVTISPAMTGAAVVPRLSQQNLKSEVCVDYAARFRTLTKSKEEMVWRPCCTNLIPFGRKCA